MSTKANKYIHPHLFKGTRITQERTSDVPGAESELVCIPVARRWQDIKGVEMLGNSKLVLGDEAPTSVTLLSIKGGWFYVTDNHDEVLAAWEFWLNDASLRHKNILSN